MSERQILSLVIRIIGLLGILYVVRHWAVLYHKTGHIHFDNIWKLIVEICLILIGLYMFTGAPILMRLITNKNENNDTKK